MTRRAIAHKTIVTHIVGVLCLLHLFQSFSTLCYAQVSSSENRWGGALVPLVNFTTDRGLGYGGFVSVFKKSNRHCVENTNCNIQKGTRYDASLSAQFYQTNKNYYYHKLIVDLPRLPKQYRLQLMLGLENWDRTPYFGLGNHTVVDQRRLQRNGAKEYSYGVNNVRLITTLLKPLSGSFLLSLGLTIRQTEIELYPESMLARDQPTGINGGHLNLARFGIMYDTRDREPDTHQGVLYELETRLSHRLIASDFNSSGVNLTGRWWYTLSLIDLTLASRIGIDIQNGNPPFFQLPIMGGSQWAEIGGNSLLRGYQFGRFRGLNTIYLTEEMRWRFTQLTLFERSLGLQLVPFIDLGRASVPKDSDPFYHIHVSGGLGLRIIYEEAFIIRLDAAFAREEHINTDNLPNIAVRRGIYAIVGHSF